MHKAAMIFIVYSLISSAENFYLLTKVQITFVMQIIENKIASGIEVYCKSNSSSILFNNRNVNKLK